MILWVRQLDQLLRGRLTTQEQLDEKGVDVSSPGLALVLILLGGIYGVCMGTFAVAGSGSGQSMQLLASAIKVPSLFFLTLLVTLPSLYVFNALVGSRLTFTPFLRLMISATAITMAVLASLGTIVAFFSFTTTSYPFVILLNVATFSLAGMLGLRFLLQTLRKLRVGEASTIPAVSEERLPPVQPISDEQLSELTSELKDSASATRYVRQQPSPADRVRKVFVIWIIIYGAVGAQMGWILRPFIGSPTQPFSWFRPRGSNFFEAVWSVITHLSR